MERKNLVGGKNDHSTAQAGGFLWDIESGVITCDSIARQLIGFELGPDCDLMRLNDMLCQVNEADKTRVEDSLSRSILVDVPFVIPFRVGESHSVKLQGEKCRLPGSGKNQILGVLQGASDRPGQMPGVQETGIESLAPLINEALSVSRAENLSFLTWLLRMALLEAAKAGSVVPGE